MKILVTGATGFIGNNLIKALLKKDFEIIASSRDEEKAKGKSWYKKVNYIRYDINECSSKNLFNFFQRPDYIIHLAWDGLPNYKCKSHIEKNLWNNYSFIKNLVENGAVNITLTGTCYEYGLANGEMNTSMLTNPSNSYSIAKDSLRRFLVLLQNEYNFKLKWLRLFYLYGEFQSKHSLFSQLVQDIENNSDYFNMSAGEQIRDFLPIEVAVEQIIKFSVETNSSILANICSGNPISVRSFVENIINERQSRIKLNLGHFKYSDIEPLAFWGNTDYIHY